MGRYPDAGAAAEAGVSLGLHQESQPDRAAEFADGFGGRVFGGVFHGNVDGIFDTNGQRSGPARSDRCGKQTGAAFA